MLIVPEMQAVFITPPRTGSDSLIQGIQKRYPSSFLLYRHAEATEVPAGYKTWHKIMVVRHPVQRMWSLYKYLHIIGNELGVAPMLEPYVAKLKQSVEGVGFEEWLLKNDLPFMPDLPHPMFHQNIRGIPENKRSQFDYTAGLDVKLVPFAGLPKFAEYIDVDLPHLGKTEESRAPDLSTRGWRHINNVMGWDMSMALGEAV